MPAQNVVERVALRLAQFALDGNRSVPPAHAGGRVIVRASPGKPHLRIHAPGGILLTAPRGAPQPLFAIDPLAHAACRRTRPGRLTTPAATRGISDTRSPTRMDVLAS